MARLKLQILGGFRLLGADGQTRRLPTRKAEALLAYLATPPQRPHRRDHLAGLLWGDRGDRQARHSLNQTVFSIRKAVAEPGIDPIVVEGDSLALNTQLVEVDADRFERLLGSDRAAASAHAAELYQGDLLEGLNLREELFMEWLEAERRRLRELALNGLACQLQTQQTEGEIEAGIQTSLRLLALDPLQEPVHRALMQFYAEQGRLGAAVQQYETCRSTLERSLGISPAADTEDLLRRIRKQRARQAGRPGERTLAAPAGKPRVTPPPEGGAAETAAGGGPPVQAERKYLSLLSAEMLVDPGAADDPEADLDLLDAGLTALTQAIDRYGGTIAGRQSNSFTALFGAPAAHEDHAVRACFAALAMVEALGHPRFRRLRVRAGLHSGEVVVRLAGQAEGGGYEAIGSAAALAGQVLRSVPPGSVGLSADTLRLAEAFVDAEPLTTLLAAGAGGSARIFLLKGRTRVMRPWHARMARGLSAFVGRESELAALTQARDRAAAGSGQVAAVVGVAGVGKSRLIHEFAEYHVGRDWRLLEAGGNALDTATAYGAVSQLLRSWIGVAPWDSQDDIVRRIRQSVLNLDTSLAPSLPVLFSLLDLPVEDAEWQTLNAPQRRRRTHACLKALLSRLSRERPLLIILEDLHWVDSETQAVLDTLVDGLQGLALLMLVTCRPEFRHDWTGRSGFSVVRLDPLPAASTERLLQHLLGDHPSLRQAYGLLADRTAGTPLFVEETVRALAGSGTLIGTLGAYRLEQEIGQVQIPDSVQGVLAARIDRLPQQSKGLLQAAAVVGIEVPDALLRAIANLSEEDYDEAVATLQAAELFYEIRHLPEVEYSFKHALTQEVAYNSLLREQKRAHHLQVVRAVETRHHGRLDEQAERLAFHAVSAGLTEEAVQYLYRAALKAIRRSAHRQAIAHVQQGLALLEGLPETAGRLRRELEFQKALGVTMMAAKGWGAQEVSAAYTRAREISAKLEDQRELFIALRGQGQFHMIRGELATARSIGEQCAALTGNMQDEGAQLETHHLFWSNSFFMGDFDNTAQHAMHGISCYEREAHHPLTYVYSGHDPGVCCRSFSGLTLWQQGFPEAALARCREALALAEETSHPLTLALAHWALSYLHLFREEPQACRDWAQREIDVCSEYLLPLLHSQGLFQLGWALAREGETAEGIARMEEGLLRIRDTGAEMGLPYFVALLSEAHAQVGEVERGLQQIEEALATADRNRAYFGHSEMLRIKGQLLLLAAPSDTAAAEACFRSAMMVASGQKARLPELRAALSLARLWRLQDRVADAHSLVRPLYDALSEGQRTPDLCNARRLLTECAGNSSQDEVLS